MKAKTASPFQIVVMSTNSDCFVFDFVYFVVFFCCFLYSSQVQYLAVESNKQR